MVNLYRFEKLEEKRIDTIANKQLWISSPSKFNDLNDCRMRGFYTGADDAEHYELIKKCLNMLYNDSNKYPSTGIYKWVNSFIHNQLADKTDFANQLKSDLRASASFAAIRGKILTNVLVSCFFEGDCNNSLMWAHYADNHMGFCIEYELVESLPEIFGFNRVNYVSLLPEIYATELLFNPYQTIARIIYSKSIEWNYEKEWRYVAFHNVDTTNIVEGENVPLPSNLKPKRIITGARFNDNSDKELDVRLRSVASQHAIEVIPYFRLSSECEDKNSAI